MVLFFSGFGSPNSRGITHSFGLNNNETFNGVHNAFYMHDPYTGRESVTIFVNAIEGTSSSYVYEFDINLVQEENVSTISDSVFNTTYRCAELPFQTNTQGGARPLSNGIGGSVYAVASGSGHKGLVIVEEKCIYIFFEYNFLL